MLYVVIAAASLIATVKVYALYRRSDPRDEFRFALFLTGMSVLMMVVFGIKGDDFFVGGFAAFALMGLVMLAGATSEEKAESSNDEALSGEPH